MSLLGAGNLGANGKQKVVQTTASRTSSFSSSPSTTSSSSVASLYTNLGPNFNGVGGMSGNTKENVARAKSTTQPVAPNPQAGVQPTPINKPSAITAATEGISNSLVNTARDIKKDPYGAVQSRAINAVVDFGNTAVNTVGNLINAETKSNLPNVSGPKVIGNVPRLGNAQWQGGSLVRNPKRGTAWSGGLYVPGEGMESINRTIGAASLIPGPGKLVGAAGEAATRGVASLAERAIAKPIIVNAAERPFAGAEGRAIAKSVAESRVKETAPRTKTPSIPPVGPMSRQLVEFAPKRELAESQPARYVTDHSLTHTDDPEFNSQELINSIYREAHANAQAEKRGTYVTPLSTNHYLIKQLGGQDDLTRVIKSRWSKVYDQLVKDKAIDTGKFADSDSFVNFIEANGHKVSGGSNYARVTPDDTIVAANKAYLKMFHGSDKSPLAYYRTSSKTDPTWEAIGDYSLDKEMGFGYRPYGVSKTTPTNRLVARVTPEQLKTPIMPIDNMRTYLDEFAQNFGEELPKSQVTSLGNQWARDASDFYSGGYGTGTRSFNNAKMYELQDAESLISKPTQEARDAAGVTESDRDRFIKIIEDKDIADLTNNPDGTFSVKWKPDALRKLSLEDIQILFKNNKTRGKALIKGKFDVDKSSGTVTGDPEGFYSQITKARQNHTIREGVSE